MLIRSVKDGWVFFYIKEKILCKKMYLVNKYYKYVIKWNKNSESALNLLLLVNLMSNVRKEESQ